MAITNTQKPGATITRRYHVDAVDTKGELRTFSIGIAEKGGPLLCKLIFRNPHHK